VDIDRLMGPGRAEFAERFREELQREIDALDPPLGIDITFLALQDAHPPDTDGVATEFQKVITAEVKKNAEIETAQGDSRQQLTLTAGNVSRAEALVEAITRRDRLAEDPDATAEAREEAEREVADLLLGNPARDIPRMSGAAATSIAQAQATRTTSVSEAESKSRLFEAEVTAYQAAPSLYRVRKYLEMLERSLELVRKYVITLDTEKTKLIVIFESEKRDVFSLAEEETSQ
jgi:regulator of protease activity HflC (stomatin/prohibitin superfamily)